MPFKGIPFTIRYMRWKKLGEVFILRSWWVWGFLAVTYFFFEHSMEKRREVRSEIASRLVQLEKEKEVALEEQEDLLFQIDSQDDPAYVELVLKRRLGLVPEGQTKVYFQEE